MAEYIDCELTLWDYDKAVLRFRGDEYDGKPTLDETFQQRLLEASLDTAQYGALLFGAAFPPQSDLITGYRIAQAEAMRENKRLRFRLCIDANAPVKLHELNWELLYDQQKKMAFSRSSGTAFSRYTNAQGRPLDRIEGKPRLLVVASSPVDLAEQGLADVNAQSLKAALEPLRASLEVEYLEGRATSGRIRERLVEGKFHLLHIQAHGKMAAKQTRPSILLENEDGTADFMDPDSFWEIFEGVPNLSLLTLVTCYSGTTTQDNPYGGLGPMLARQGLPAIIAMRNTISFEAAERFCKHLYSNLVRSGVVDAAVNEARKQMYLTDPPGRDWGRPTIFMRLKDGRLWDPVDVARGVQVAKSQPDWRMILFRLNKRNIVPILGPEINRGLVLSDEEISERWAREFNYPGDDSNDLPRVAKFVETKVAINYPHEMLIEVLKTDLLERQKEQLRAEWSNLSMSGVIERMAQGLFSLKPDDPHCILAELPISTYITTNYDSFTTQAIRHLKPNRKPKREYCLWRKVSGDEEYSRLDSPYQTLRGTEDAPLIFHLYGLDEKPRSLVLTEDDYLEFLRLVSKDSWRIPQLLRSTITEAMLIFLGFNIRDLNFRVLFKGLIDQLKDDTLGRIAVLQIDPDEGYRQQAERVDELQAFMAKDCSNLRIEPYWGTVRDFLIELRNKKNAN
ncbi:MAG TPA: CHAT domain-containing protein [Blastocatellia bacterium]|nr:CHAT domain-containing protein [Blastocatellia bacterium]